MTRWTELAKQKVEARVPCPHCKSLNYFEGFLNSFWLAKNGVVQQTQCSACRKFYGYKCDKEGVETV